MKSEDEHDGGRACTNCRWPAGKDKGGGGVPAPPNGGGASLANDDAAMNAIFFRRKRVQLVNTSVTTHLV